MKTLPKFAVVVGYYIPADGPCDPARHTRNVIAYAETAAWAQVLARRAYEKHFVYINSYTNEPDYDDQGYTEVFDMVAGRRYCPPRPVVVSETDDCIPF